jgi:hypothetical protein
MFQKNKEIYLEKYRVQGRMLNDLIMRNLKNIMISMKSCGNYGKSIVVNQKVFRESEID